MQPCHAAGKCPVKFEVLVLIEQDLNLANLQILAVQMLGGLLGAMSLFLLV